MKLNYKNNKYTLEFNQDEANILFTVFGQIAVNYQSVSNLTFDLFQELSNLGCSKIATAKQTKEWNGLEFNDIKIETKNCSFLYPKSNARKYSPSCLNVDDYEVRELEKAYIDGNYLMGIDKEGVKKFILSKVKHLNWKS